MRSGPALYSANRVVSCARLKASVHIIHLLVASILHVLGFSNTFPTAHSTLAFRAKKPPVNAPQTSGTLNKHSKVCAPQSAPRACRMSLIGVPMRLPGPETARTLLHVLRKKANHLYQRNPLECRYISVIHGPRMAAAPECHRSWQALSHCPQCRCPEKSPLSHQLLQPALHWSSFTQGTLKLF